MKKAISLAVILASIVFSSDVSALPVFARQTGMACNACHFQHYPMLNAFGRAFKGSGFTIVGSQSKVEGDSLSIPSTLNMAALTTAGYTKTNQTGAGSAVGVRGAGDGAVYVPGTNGELSLFVGGRVGESAGFLSELGFLGTPGLGSAKLPILLEVADSTRAGVVLFTTGGQGASYGYEVLNTGANAIHTMLFIGGDANGSIGPALSAQQYIGTNKPATGAAIVVNNPMGFVNLTKFHQVGPADAGAAGLGSFTGGSLSSTYFRAAGTFELAGWDAGAGIQYWSGQSTTLDNTFGAGTAAIGEAETKATAIDFQLQGAAGGMPVGLYVTYARAPKLSTSATTGAVSAFNPGGTETRSAFNIAAELGVVPEKATVGVGVRMGKSGQAVGTATNATDNAILLEGSYKLAQNMMVNLYFTKQSGGFWNAANTAATGSRQTTINLSTIF